MATTTSPTTSPFESIDAFALSSVQGGCGKHKQCCPCPAPQACAPAPAPAPMAAPAAPSVETSVNVSYR